MQKIEFIESYVVKDGDYEWNDNHGQLVRCKACVSFDRIGTDFGNCRVLNRAIHADGYCCFAKKKEEGKE